MKKMTLFAVLVMILAILMSGCKGQTTAQGAGETTDTQEVTAQTTDDTQASETTLSETQAETEAEDTQSSEMNSSEKTNSEGEEYIYFSVSFYDNSHAEYTLSIEESEFIRKLFYNHEKRVTEFLSDSVSTVYFRIGNDFLYTSMADDTMEGSINWEFVRIELSEAERQQLREIVEMHVGDLSKVP